MASWDVFHADQLELRRGLNAREIREALARGELNEDDLVRPAGSSLPWSRLVDLPDLEDAAPPDAPVAPVHPPAPEAMPPRPLPVPAPPSSSDVAFPVFDQEPEPPNERDRPVGHPSREGDLPRTGRTGHTELEILADEDDLADIPPPPRGSVTIRSNPMRPLEPRARRPDSAPGHDLSARRHASVPEPDVPPHPTRRPPAEPEPPSAIATPVYQPTGQVSPAASSEARGHFSQDRGSRVGLPVVHSRDRDDERSEAAELATEVEFSLSRGGPAKIEELDLAPMVDVAFQLVLFFMVTATTVLYKTLEIPKPSAEAPAAAVAQGRNRSLDDLKEDYILVEVDTAGVMKLDREPIEPTMSNLVERMRTAREKTGRKAMLLSADFATPHRNAVLAYDAANEIGLGIAIARPQPTQGPGPIPRAGPAAARPAAPPA